MRHAPLAAFLILLAACAPPPRLPERVDALLRHCLGDEVKAFRLVSLETGPSLVTDDAAADATALDLVGFFQAQLRHELSAPDLAFPAHLLVITDSNRAARVRAFLAGDRDPHALASRDALVFFGPLGGPETVARLAHELAHAALRAAFPSGLPLWLEEGLAQHWSRVHAKAWLAFRQIPHQELPVPVLPPAPPGAARLTAVHAYPVEAGAVEAFYRQSQRFAAELDAARAQTPWPTLLRALADAPPRWRETLKIRFHFSDADLQRLDDLDLLRP